MVEAGSSTNAEQCSASGNVDSERSVSNNQELIQDTIRCLATQIEDLKSEINLYSSRVSQNQKKLEQMQLEMQLKINQDKSKELVLKKKLENLMKAQSHLIDSCRENTSQENVEIQTDQQDNTINKEINLPTTSSGCNNQRNSVRVAQSASQTELIESAGGKSDNQDNTDDEVSSQNISDNASVSSYRPSEYTQSTETQMIEEVNGTAANNLPWEIACQKLLHTIWENKDSYHFRDPVDEKIYKDYRKFVITPLCLRDVEESFKSGVYKSPLDFSKDMRIIFDNSRKYNIDETALIYKQTTRLKKLYEDQIKEIISNWRATKKSRTSSGSKRRINDPNDNNSDADDDSQSKLKCRPKRRKHFLSDDESSFPSVIDENNDDDDDDAEYDDNDSEDNEPVSTRLRNAQRKARGMQDNDTESSESDTEDDDSFMESSDEDQSNAYEDDSAYMDEEVEYENLEPLTSESTIEKFVCGDFVTITGKVCKVFKTITQPSVLKGKDFKLYKFLLKTNEGIRNVECVAWEDMAIRCQSKIRRNQVITLEKVKVKSAEGKCYNQGDFAFQLVLYNTSKIIHH